MPKWCKDRVTYNIFCNADGACIYMIYVHINLCTYQSRQLKNFAQGSARLLLTLVNSVTSTINSVMISWRLVFLFWRHKKHVHRD